MSTHTESPAGQHTACGMRMSQPGPAQFPAPPLPYRDAHMLLLLLLLHSCTDGLLARALHPKGNPNGVRVG